MTSLPSLGDMQLRLDELAKRYRVPGVAVGWLDGDQEYALATGVLNLNTGVAATPDSVFQIGSITKVLTATLVLQLLDDGRLSLDDPIALHLPELRLAEQGGAEAVTVEHLLTHTSGIEGDHFEDCGRGDDAIDRYIESLRNVGLIHRPGALVSYCNTGYVILGALVERLRGCTWDEALRHSVARPLAMRDLCTLPEEAVLHRVAAGHFQTPHGSPPVVTSRWSMPRSQGPSGGTACATVGDLLALARCFIDDGRAPNGSPVLSAASALRMQERLVDLPTPAPDRPAQGLGWQVLEWDGVPVLNHNGATIGQTSFLHVIPSRNFAVAVLANSLETHDLADALVRDLTTSVSGLSVPPRPTPPAEPPDTDLTPYVGTYERLNSRTEVSESGGSLFVDVTYSGTVASIFGESGGPPMQLSPVAPDTFCLIGPHPVRSGHRFVVFLRGRDGHPHYLWSGRVSRRADARRSGGYL